MNNSMIIKPINNNHFVDSDHFANDGYGEYVCWNCGSKDLISGRVLRYNTYFNHPLLKLYNRSCKCGECGGVYICLPERFNYRREVGSMDIERLDSEGGFDPRTYKYKW